MNYYSYADYFMIMKRTCMDIPHGLAERSFFGGHAVLQTNDAGNSICISSLFH